MAEEHCTQLENIPKEGEKLDNPDFYKCKITGKRCIGATYEVLPGEGPTITEEPPYEKISENKIAHYHDSLAQSCPVYGITDSMANTVRGLNRQLEFERDMKEKIMEIEKVKEEHKAMKKRFREKMIDRREKDLEIREKELKRLKYELDKLKK